MEFLRQCEAIQWKDGISKNIVENTVKDEYTYLFIDSLHPRKFSTYPQDLKDFAIGYSLGEGLIKALSDIISIEVDGTEVFIKTRFSHEDSIQSDVNLLEYQGVNSDSAGGVRTQSKTIKPVSSDFKVNATQIIEDVKHLTAEAKIWQKTGGVHVAQIKYDNKSIIREDVSRHVAVDKVIGAAFSEGFEFSKSYISYSGRMPADMLRKVVRVGIPIIISNAAPASSGLDVAIEGNITMVGFVRDNRFTVYTSPERIDFEK